MHDEVGRDVIILDLYKFLVGHKKPNVTSMGIHDDSRAVVHHDDGDEVVYLRAALHQ